MTTITVQPTFDSETRVLRYNLLRPILCIVAPYIEDDSKHYYVHYPSGREVGVFKTFGSAYTVLQNWVDNAIANGTSFL